MLRSLAKLAVRPRVYWTAVGFTLVILLAHANRYELVRIHDRLAYKLDRWTGRVGWVSPAGQKEVPRWQPAPEESPEEKVIRLVKGSAALGGVYSVERTIKKALENRQGYLHIIGWEASRIDDQTFVVSYTYQDDAGELQWAFEVTLPEGMVRNITFDDQAKEGLRGAWSRVRAHIPFGKRRPLPRALWLEPPKIERTPHKGLRPDALPLTDQ